MVKQKGRSRVKRLRGWFATQKLSWQSASSDFDKQLTANRKYQSAPHRYVNNRSDWEQNEL